MAILWAWIITLSPIFYVFRWTWIWGLKIFLVAYHRQNWYYVFVYETKMLINFIYNVFRKYILTWTSKLFIDISSIWRVHLLCVLQSSFKTYFSLWKRVIAFKKNEKLLCAFSCFVYLFLPYMSLQCHGTIFSLQGITSWLLAKEGVSYWNQNPRDKSSWNFFEIVYFWYKGTIKFIVNSN